MIQGVRRVYNSGKTKPYEWRYKQLQGMLKLLDENRDAIVNALREDLHKPKFEANLSEIDYCRNDLIDTMNNLSTWMKPEKVKKKIINIMDNAYVHRDPYGVVLVMGAWNYPIQLTVMPVYGALSAGNCVVLKPSEVSPATAKLLEELIPKYIDNDAVKVVNGGIPETTALLKERFDYIFYTGNSAVGKIVMQAAAKYLTPVTLELGGKSPVYLDENSDMNIAAHRILCVYCTYIYFSPVYVDENSDMNIAAHRILYVYCTYIYFSPVYVDENSDMNIAARRILCVYCTYIYFSPVYVDENSDMNIAARRILCVYCTYIYFSPVYVDENSDMNIAARRILCVYCTYIYFSPVYVDENSDMNIAARRILCVYCTYIYFSPVYVDENSDMNIAARRILCVYCTYIYFSPVYVDENSDMNIAARRILCVYCTYIYFSPVYVDENSDMNIASHRILCVYCTYIYFSPVYVDENSDMNIAARRILCVYCTYNYFSPVYVDENSDMNIAARRILCVYCTYIYFSPVYVDENSDMNIAARRILCVYCTYIYFSPVYVDENSDMNIAARRILCVYCTYIYFSPVYVDENSDMNIAARRILCVYCTYIYFSPVYVDENSDMNIAARRILWGKCSNAGQTCIAPDYVMCTKEAQIFGPVLPIMPVRNEDEAIDFINKREKPLSMYVFTKNPQLGQKFRDTTSSGSFVVNDTIMQAGVMTLPFGGVGNSGMGAYHGHRTFDTFCHQKAVLERQQKMESAQSIRYPPYSDNKYAWIRRLAANKPKKSGLVSVIPFFLLGTLMAFLYKMIQGVRKVFNSGKTKPYEWRYRQLQGMLKLLEENRDAITTALSEDLHKPKFEANLTEIDYCRNDLIDTMNNLSTWMKPEKVKKGIINMLDKAYVYRDPFGVILVMGAWNYPIQLTLMPVYGALSAGNCVVLKPSEVSPATAKLLEELIPKYIDNDAVKVVNGGIPETTALLKERFDYIFYTGNSAVGKIVMQAAAKYLTPVTLELGGKSSVYVDENSDMNIASHRILCVYCTYMYIYFSPVYVDENSDMNIAARRILWGKCSNAGQTCIAPDYVMCTKEAQDKLVAEMKKTLDDFFPGSSISKTEDFGRIVNSRHFQRVKRLMESSGRVAIGGDTNENENFIAPTILTDCKEEDPALQEEVWYFI
ncbi:hypothetical protein FSP39_007827 [Pinctada imbricata]|uniref:Aldehyde dehydrogenase domain-containing protein n=1 Tax=Pinctada imbricata TaxID=66713 RepID=A0AA89C5J8_PINIB|nr:hypothetical protein FSP39_007827 [Pinctada imbricata]